MRSAAYPPGWWIILVILWGGDPALAQLYHWTNADGVRHFSNTPPPDGATATVVKDEIPYDPETDHQRRVQEDALLRERESAKMQERLENAERAAQEARHEAETARRRANQLEKELEDQDEDRSYGVYYPRRRPGNRPPGYRPPGQRPPGQRPPGQRPPGWRPKPTPYAPTTETPGQQPRQQTREMSPQGRPGK